MRVKDVIDALLEGELNNLNMLDSNGNLKPERLKKIIDTINLGLTDLHTRFLLKKNILDLEVTPCNDTYEILKEDFIEILHINNHLVNYSLLKPNTIYINTHCPTIICIEYKANHRRLTELDYTYNTIIDLPLSYLQALLDFCAYRLYTSMVNQLDGDLNESVRYMQKYQEQLAVLTNQGIDVDNIGVDYWFYQRGFV
ncbi:hypothetical protein ACF3NV_07800 [Moraxella atlantae]|uniref:hypothetical protein n=1 Tax=Faucicola atlantae TaxID=34059 RepID=UPI003752F019